MNTKPKVLVFDIETLPNEGYFFDIFSDRGIPLQFVKRPKSIVTIAYKWLGERKSRVLAAVLPYDDKAILRTFMEVFVQADYTIGHYADGFDTPFLSARLLANGLDPLPPVTSIDTYKLAKKHFGRSLNSNKLDHLGEVLGVGKKHKTDASLWVRCAEGDKKALKEMADYNVQDVVLLEKVALKLLPYVASKLNMNLFKSQAEHLCENCGSSDVQKRGTIVTKTTKKQRIQCLECAHWSSVKLEVEGGKEKKTGIVKTKSYSQSRKKAPPKDSSRQA